VKLIRDLKSLPKNLRSGAVSIGNFDGVHVGHARIVERLVAEAQKVQGPAIVFTFDPPPAQVLRPDRAPPPLTWLERKVQLLTALGVDAVIAYPTDEAFLRQEPRQFFDQILRETLDARALIEGPNFFFGHDRHGNVDLLSHYCAEAGMTMDTAPPVEVDGQMVSSSRLRALIGQGQVELARRMLTEPYRIHGLVIHGARRGSELGYPTANLGKVDTLLPAEGIYAGRAFVDGKTWPAAISLGPNPTFDEGALKVEIHLVDFCGDLYDQDLEVDFLTRLRDIEKFDTVAALVAQMDRDIDRTRMIAAEFEAAETE
jgi:riboflavin kinase/FMN adenylyltransferase